MKRLSHMFFISLIFSGCFHSEHKEKKESPAKVEIAAQGEMPKVILTPEAEKRLGIDVISIQSTSQMPPSAILYDLKGVTWVYVRTAPQTFSRVHAESRKQEQQTVEVVIRGAAELYGAESGVGK